MLSLTTNDPQILDKPKISEEMVGCRLCLNLKYKSQRFKGIIESI